MRKIIYKKNLAYETDQLDESISIGKQVYNCRKHHLYELVDQLMKFKPVKCGIIGYYIKLNNILILITLPRLFKYKFKPNTVSHNHVIGMRRYKWSYGRKYHKFYKIFAQGEPVQCFNFRPKCANRMSAQRCLGRWHHAERMPPQPSNVPNVYTNDLDLRHDTVRFLEYISVF
jgi:hypothetical protein